MANMFTDFDTKLKIAPIADGSTSGQKPYEQCNLEVVKVEVKTAREAGMLLLNAPQYLDNPCMVFHIKDYDLTGKEFTVTNLCFYNQDGMLQNPIQKGFTNAKTLKHKVASQAYDIYKAICLSNKDKIVDLELLEATDPKKYVGYKFKMGLKTAVKDGEDIYFLETEFQKQKDIASAEKFKAQGVGPIEIPKAKEPNVGINPGDDENDLPPFLK